VKVSVCPGVAVGIPCDAWCSHVGMPNVSQAGLEPASGSVGALLFSQCKVAWSSFVWAGDSGCRSFDSSLCFFLPILAPESQQDF
jgi:hypothetical protein